MRLEIFDFAKPNLRLWWPPEAAEGGTTALSASDLPPTVSALRRSHLPLEGEASELCRKKRTGATGSGPLDRFLLFDFQDLAVVQLLIFKFVVQWIFLPSIPRQIITGVLFSSKLSSPLGTI